VVIVAVLFFVLSSGRGLPESKRKSGGKPKIQTTKTPSSSGGGMGIPNIGPVIMMGGPGRTHTREVTREVVKEVEVPVAPRSIDCPYCGRSYVPAEQSYACPACGAATPKELIEESESPKNRSGN
jgi:hypothetical protein